MDQVDTDVTTRLKSWAIRDALPLWGSRGWDATRGGFVEGLGPDGVPDSEAPRRLRVLARQIYCFAHAARLGWYPEGRGLALRGLDYMLAKAKSPDGEAGYASRLSPEGIALSTARDTYDHAFVLLALAHVFQLEPDNQIRAEIDAVLTFLDEKLRSVHGGYLEGLPSRMLRRQNPHMHLFEAMIALFDATQDVDFLKRAGDIFGLFTVHFYDARTGFLGEYYEEDWSRIVPVRIEPGHHAEWVWLLRGFERISGCPTARYRDKLLEAAMRHRDPVSGCLIDEADAEGHILKPTGRCWPQTELVKAWLVRAETGDADALGQAMAALTRLEWHYLTHPVKGGWYDDFDRGGAPRNGMSRASSFYHILCAIMEADRIVMACSARNG